jgi:copper chaperone
MLCCAESYTPSRYITEQGTSHMSTLSPHPPTVSSEHRLVYVVPGMTCDHCTVAVTEEVAGVPGVAAVDADLDTKLVRVHGRALDPAAVVAAIDEAGYDAVAA